MLNVDFGRLICIGIIVAIPAMLVGHWWAVFAGKRIPHVSAGNIESIEESRPGPGVIQSFLPVILPILLISVKSFLTMDQVNSSGWIKGFLVLGDPIIALSIGIVLAFIASVIGTECNQRPLLQESVKKGATILASLALEECLSCLAATKPGVHLSEMAGLRNLGLFFPSSSRSS
jgi:GntP family gluconate:H+ symporter